MAQSKEDLEKLFELVKAVSEEPGNEWINEKFKQHFGDNSTLNPSENSGFKELKNDTEYIRQSLNIKGDVTINYNFIAEQRIKKQLLKDNLRMENSRLDNNFPNETDRFYNFCVNAFYQIEELVNYFYLTKHGLDKVTKHLNSIYDKIKPDEVFSKIIIANKIIAFEKEFYYKKNEKGENIYFDSIITQIKNTRNEDSHRCNVIEKDEVIILKEFKDLMALISTAKNKGDTYKKKPKDYDIESKKKLMDFIKEKNFNLVRVTVNDVALKVLQNLENKQQP